MAERGGELISPLTSLTHCAAVGQRVGLWEFLVLRASGAGNRVSSLLVAVANEKSEPPGVLSAAARDRSLPSAFRAATLLARAPACLSNGARAGKGYVLAPRFC